MALDQTRAFPSPGETKYEDDGMLLWDYYAAHAMSAVIEGTTGYVKPDQVAKYCATYADAMMAERARRNTFSKEP